MQLEISAIESISKRSVVDEESSVQSTASSKATKKPRGRGRAAKKSEESSMISKKNLADLSHNHSSFWHGCFSKHLRR